MKIFYLKKDEFLKTITIEELEKYSDGRNYKSKDKYIEHLCGLYLVKNIAKNVFKIEDTEIEIINSKPKFKNSNLYFNISHSNNIIMVAFSKNDIGIDVQYMKNIDYSKILERYNVHFDEPTPKKFFEFWTFNEAKIKLGNNPTSQFSTIIEENYMVTCVSNSIIVSTFGITKI